MATGQYIGVASKKITLTNLVPAMSSLSFAVGSSSGTCEMSTAHTKYGSTALCNTGVAGYNEMYALSSQKFQLIPDHFYYACVEVYQESKLGSVDFFWPSASPSMFGGQAPGNAGTWKKCSNVTTRSSFAAGEYPIRLDFNNGGTAGKMWYDGLMLIDLTEAFGAGNEPGTAWCEANIPYFTGTTTVERYTESGVARKVVSSYIGVKGVARKVTSGYVGVNGVARLFFAPESGAPVILEVEKVTSDTYEGETTYTAEEFILLDIYPKTGGTVNVTYGGLTKTITDTSGVEEPNAQQVYFGTFHGVTDSVATPASGKLTIEGSCRGFGVGSVGLYKGAGKYVGGIRAVTDWGSVYDFIPSNAFNNCSRLTNIDLPDGVTIIRQYAFSGCTGLTNINLPDGVTTIGESAFSGCTGLTNINLPDSVTIIRQYAFYNCLALIIDVFPKALISIGGSAFCMPTKKTADIAMYGKTIIFPSTLKSIGDSAFRTNDYEGTGSYEYFTYLSGAVMLSATPPTLDSNAFGSSGFYASSKKMSITVPAGCGEVYKAADGWAGYKSRIVEAT